MAELERPRDADHLRELVQTSYGRLRAALDRVPEVGWEDPALAGGWTVKDVLAHVTLWEGALLWHVDPGFSYDAVELDLPWGDTDAVNERYRARVAAEPAAEVRERADRTHSRLSEVLAQLQDSQLEETVTNGDRPWWRAVAAETWDHYPEHLAMVEAAFPA